MVSNPFGGKTFREYHGYFGNSITDFDDRWPWMKAEMARPYINMSPEQRFELNRIPMADRVSQMGGVGDFYGVTRTGAQR
jgi:hypothetical protein